jgi:hypothetical protein
MNPVHGTTRGVPDAVRPRRTTSHGCVGVLAVVLVASLAINVETTIVNAVLPTLNTDPTWLNLVHTVGADFAERSAEIVG